MKRFIVIAYDEVSSLDTIGKEHLIRLKQGSSDYIIDTLEGTYFDDKTNMWVAIE